MKEELISYQTAKLANLKGFDPNVKLKKNTHYSDLTESLDSLGAGGAVVVHHYYAATQSLLQKWVREVHQLYVELQVDQTTYPKFYFEVTMFIGNPKNLSEKEWGWESKYHAEYLYRTYEEALEEGLQIALKLI